MNMEQAATFLAGSVLVMLGTLVVVSAIVAINNILHRYWKPVTFFRYDYRTYHEEEIQKTDPPGMDKPEAK
jgi:hypothetical protein